MKIAYLYYDFLNLYGESGNIKIISNVLKENKVKHEILYLSLDDELVYIDGNVIKKKILGFINNNSYISDIKYHLFDNEGIKYNNFYGTYVLGPILVRNPEFLKYFLNNLTDKKLKYDLKIEIKAYNEFIKNFKENL